MKQTMKGVDAYQSIGSLEKNDLIDRRIRPYRNLDNLLRTKLVLE